MTTAAAPVMPTAAPAIPDEAMRAAGRKQNLINSRARAVPAQQVPPLAYKEPEPPAWGVWIDGEGWLRLDVSKPEDAFASEHEAVAVSAARLINSGLVSPRAHAMIMDASLIVLETQLLQLAQQNTEAAASRVQAAAHAQASAEAERQRNEEAARAARLARNRDLYQF